MFMRIVLNENIPDVADIKGGTIVNDVAGVIHEGQYP
jgi:hypothetical protein